MSRCFSLTISSWSRSCPDEDRVQVCCPHIHGGIFLHSSLLLPLPPSVISQYALFYCSFREFLSILNWNLLSYPSLVLVCMLTCARNGEYTAKHGKNMANTRQKRQINGKTRQKLGKRTTRKHPRVKLMLLFAILVHYLLRKYW